MKIKSFTKLALILILTFTFAKTQSQVNTLFNQYCNSTRLNSLQISQTERETARLALKGSAFSGTSLSNYLNDSNISPIISQIGAAVILAAILVIAVLQSFITFLTFFCCCDRAAEPSTKCAKLFALISLLFLVCFVSILAAFVYYAIGISSNMTNAVCGIIAIPYDLLFGAQYPNMTFIGFPNLQYVLGNFSNSAPNLSQVSQNFNNIVSQNLPQSTGPAISSLFNFYIKYTNSKTANGNGIQSAPAIIQTLIPGINAQIQKEFSFYDITANQLTNACRTGVLMGQDSSIVNAFQSSSTSFVAQLANITDYLNITISGAALGVNMILKYSPIGTWVAVGTGGVICLLSLLGIIAICLMSGNGSSSYRTCVKLCLAINGFILVVLGLIGLLLLIVSIVITSTCQIVPTLLNTDPTNILKTINSFGFNLSNPILNTISNCLPIGASGNISDIVSNTNPNATNVINYLDGLTLYNSIKNNLTSESLISPAINQTISLWSNILTSVYPDHSTAISSLVTLNQQVSCGNISFQMNSINCTNNPSCQGIFQVNTANIPACAPSSAQQLFINLKAFVVDEANLMSGMISDLNSTGTNNSSTPNSLQMGYRTSLNLVQQDFEAIKSLVGNFLTPASIFPGGLIQNTNCTILRQEIMNLEVSVCFNLNNYLYMFSALLLGAVFSFLIMSWMLYCAIRFVGASVEVIVPLSNEKSDRNKYYQQDMENIVY